MHLIFLQVYSQRVQPAKHPGIFCLFVCFVDLCMGAFIASFFTPSINEMFQPLLSNVKNIKCFTFRLVKFEDLLVGFRLLFGQKEQFEDITLGLEIL